jgi:hypothetical protein
MARTNRPDNSKFSTADKKRFLSLLETNYGNITKTCRQMRILGGHATIKTWRDRHDWFDKAMAEMRQKIFDDVESNVFEAAVDGSPFDPACMSARRFLLCYHPEGRARGYAARSELAGVKESPLSFVQLVERADEERNRATDKD